MNINWSDVSTEVIAGLILAAIIGLVSLLHRKSQGFREFMRSVFTRLRPIVTWVAKRGLFFLVLTIAAYINYFYLAARRDLSLAVLSLINLLFGILLFPLFSTDNRNLGKRLLSSRSEKIIPISIPPGVANARMRNRYLDLPVGKVQFGSVEFMIEEDQPIFDTGEQIRSSILRRDGSKEVEVVLQTPLSAVRSVHFLINSGNSKAMYASEKVGEIILDFLDAPPIVTNLVLGNNIREWCIGNSGDLVRDATDITSRVAWKGTNSEGTAAVLDCLEIPVFDCLINSPLAKINFVHKDISRDPDDMGVHYSIFAISLKIMK